MKAAEIWSKKKEKTGEEGKENAQRNAWRRGTTAIRPVPPGRRRGASFSLAQTGSPAMQKVCVHRPAGAAGNTNRP